MENKEKKDLLWSAFDIASVYVGLIISLAVSLWYSCSDITVIILFAFLTVMLSVTIFTDNNNTNRDWESVDDWNRVLSLIVFTFVIYSRDPNKQWTGGFGALALSFLFYFVAPALIGLVQYVTVYMMHNREATFPTAFFMFMIWLTRLIRPAFVGPYDYYWAVVLVIFGIIACYAVKATVLSAKKRKPWLAALPVVIIAGAIALFTIFSLL